MKKKMNSSDNNLDEDISIELANYTEPALESALMIRRRIDKENIKGFDSKAFLEKFSKPRKLDIGCGSVIESGWIRLDFCERFKPDLLMDVHNLLIPNESISIVRMNYVLGYTHNPEKVLSEIWRVLAPNGILRMINGAPASDIQLMPGIKHAFPKEFWNDVTENNTFLYIPKEVKGTWILEKEKYDWSPTATKLSSKLKLSREIVIKTFRNVASNQHINLRKKKL